MVRHTLFLQNRASLEPVDNVLSKLRKHAEWFRIGRRDYVTCIQRAMPEAGSDVNVRQSRVGECWNSLADARKLCMSTYGISTSMRLRYNPLRMEEVRRFEELEGVVRAAWDKLKQRNPPWTCWNLKVLECSAAVTKS